MDILNRKLPQSRLVKVKNAQGKARSVVVTRRTNPITNVDSIAAKQEKFEAVIPSSSNMSRRVISGSAVEKLIPKRARVLDRGTVTAMIGPHESPKVMGTSLRKKVPPGHLLCTLCSQYVPQDQLAEHKLDVHGFKSKKKSKVASTLGTPKMEGTLAKMAKALTKPKKKKAKRKPKSIRTVSGGGANGTGRSAR